MTHAQVLRPDPEPPEMKPTGKGWGVAVEKGAKSNGKPGGGGPGGGGGGSLPCGQYGIQYHGGPIMVGTPNAYYIWYGNWSDFQKSILEDLISNLGGSAYYNINTTYCDSNGNFVSNAIAYSSSNSTTDNYSQGTSFGDAGVKAIVSDAITSGKLPKDSNGVYMVLTSPEVKETSGFCKLYCGWHTHGTIGGSDIKYAFIGNPSQQCPNGCQMYSGATPNGDAGVDGMASVIAHEFEEATADPALNAWYDRRGYENADKCAWTFGSVSTDSNGAHYNVILGSRKYLIQRNWVNASGGYCSMSY